VRIRRGPRKGIANESEERILAERRTAGHLTFDAQPCVGSTLADLALDLFTTGYRPLAIDAEVIAENARDLEIQLATLRFYDLAKNCPTHAGVLLFGKNPLYHEPHAYVVYVRYDGSDQGADILRERQFSGDLLTILRELDAFAKTLPVGQPIAASALREKLVYDYPPAAVRELLMNAVMHRAYDQPSFIRILHFSDRIEISSPGPLYGLANASNFPRQTSYRNPVIAEAMKVLGFVNRFGRGVERAQTALTGNGSPPAEFEFGDTFFGVTLRARP
jgi:ATP-dependent DNA helicase RecG